MSFSLSDITFLIRLLLDILVVWGLIYSGLRIVRNNSRTIQLVKGVLIIVLIKACLIGVLMEFDSADNLHQRKC